MPNDQMPNDDEVTEPDSKDDAALRWGRYVIQHFQPAPGDVFVIKGPSSRHAEEKRKKMADALETAAEEQGIGDVAFIIGPSHLANIHQIPEEEMNRLGYRRTSDPDPVPES
jgi:hypothetical protein